VFGIDVSESRHLAGQPEPGVRGPLATEGREPGLRFRLNFDAGCNSHETSLLHPQDLTSLASALPNGIDPTRYRYAVVGLEDDGADSSRLSRGSRRYAKCGAGF
jgi:hypothetical protein